MTESVFVEALRVALSERLGRAVDLSAFADTLWKGLHPNEPMIAFMASLRDDGYRMALLTNNVREWELRWRALAPVDEIFELVIDSAFVGMRKPDPEIYELCLERLEVAAGECLFVDDREDNCEGARAVGMRVVRYLDFEQAAGEIRAALGASASRSG
jgi:putative hydrolase of the HAD superfamily